MSREGDAVFVAWLKSELHDPDEIQFMSGFYDRALDLGFEDEDLELKMMQAAGAVATKRRLQ